LNTRRADRGPIGFVAAGNGIGMTDKTLIWDRGEALRFIRAQLNELCLVAASLGVPLLGYVLDMAYTETDDIIQREHPRNQGKPQDAD